MIETFTLAPTGEQNLDSMLAFAKSLLTRKIAAGTAREDGKVLIYMLPDTAARYKEGKPSYADDREAVIAAIRAAGYTSTDTAVDPAPVEPQPEPPPGPTPRQLRRQAHAAEVAAELKSE